MIINKEALEAAKKVFKAYTPDMINVALGYAAFIAPFESLSDEEKARMAAKVQIEANKRARKIYEEES
jgi:hypothetical protein